MPEFYMIFARKTINKMREFYMIFARKIFPDFLGGVGGPRLGEQVPPSPTPMAKNH